MACEALKLSRHNPTILRFLCNLRMFSMGSSAGNSGNNCWAGSNSTTCFWPSSGAGKIRFPSQNPACAGDNRAANKRIASVRTQKNGVHPVFGGRQPYISCEIKTIGSCKKLRGSGMANSAKANRVLPLEYVDTLHLKPFSSLLLSETCCLRKKYRSLNLKIHFQPDLTMLSTAP